MRITGGIHRSRPLRAPRGDATRPTSDRVREALFSILAGERDLEGARVLDLYAGTGALALEALSRGAAEATLVESARDALAAIRANVDALGLAAHARIIAGTVERAPSLLASSAPFDLVLADPPYADATTRAPRAIAALAAAGLFALDARVVLEHASRDASPAIAGLALEATRRYGDSALGFYARIGECAADA
jgi:16S rRNA (guanine966-N2)-methyltransferase